MKEYMCPSCLYYIKGEVNKCPNCGYRIRPKLDRITKSKLKKIAWKEFSSYIRLKQCIKTTGEIDTGICYTCGRAFSIDKLQAGHLKNGRTNDTLFDEDYIRIQCVSCNVIKNGNQGIFVLNIIEELTQNGMSLRQAVDTISDYILSKPDKITFTNEQLCEKIKYYTEAKEKLTREYIQC